MSEPSGDKLVFHTAGRVSAADMSALSSVCFHLNNDADVCYPRATSSDRHFAFLALCEISSTQTVKVMQFFFLLLLRLFLCTWTRQPRPPIASR